MSTQDYHYGSPSVSSPEKHYRSAIPIMVFLMGILFGVGVVYWIKPKSVECDTADSIRQTTTKKLEHPKTESPSSISWDFDEILKEAKIEIPPAPPPILTQVIETTPINAREPAHPTAPSSPILSKQGTETLSQSKPMHLAPTPVTETVTLRIGTFSNSNLADRLKDKVAAIGVRTEVQHIVGKDNKAYYRVVLGPFPSSDSGTIRRKLRELRIDGFH